jgi:hypothetical protein
MYCAVLPRVVSFANADSRGFHTLFETRQESCQWMYALDIHLLDKESVLKIIAQKSVKSPLTKNKISLETRQKNHFLKTFLLFFSFEKWDFFIFQTRSCNL